ncbi:MAG TPA: hypothetical protein DC064_00340, partial [Cyanobacteria bacterium UBA9273]|nr:hypothetical protein [Cyanobacteria bacterium UBA9273]
NSDVTFKDDVTLAAGDTPTTLNGNVTLDGLKFQSGGNATFGNDATAQITLSTDNVSISTTANNSNLVFNGAVDGSQNLNLQTNGTGNITFNSAVGSQTSVGDIQATSTGTTRFNSTVQAASLTTNTGGETQLNGNVTTTGTLGQNYGDNLRIDNSITLNSGNSPVNFSSTVNSQTGEANDLTITSGTGNITFNDQVGNNQPLGNLQANSTGTTSFNSTVQAASVTTDAGGETQLKGDVTTTGTLGQNYSDNLRIKNSTTLNSGNSPVNISGTLDSETGESNNLTVTSGTGNITFNSQIGNSQPLGDLQANSTGTTSFNSTVQAASVHTNTGGTTQLNGNVTTTGSQGQTYDDSLSLTGDITLTGAELNFNNTVSGTGNLKLQPLSPTQAIAIGGSDNTTSALDLTVTEVGNIQNGFASITIGRPDGMGTITIDSIEFKDPVTIQSPVASGTTDQYGPTTGSIDVNGLLRGTDNASIFLNAPRINLKNNIITPGQTITLGQPNGIMVLHNDVELKTNDSGINEGKIIVESIVTGLQQDQQLLTLTLGINGQAILRGSVGNPYRLRGLTINNELGTVIIGGENGTLPGDSANIFKEVIVNALQTTLSGIVRTLEGNITLNGNVTLIADTVLNTGTAAGGNIYFNGTLDSEYNEYNDLRLIAGTGHILFNKTVGAGTGRELGAIIIENAENVSSNSTIAGASFTQLAGSGTTTLNGDITTTAPAGVNITTDKDITTTNITSAGGGIALTSQTGNVVTSNLNADDGPVNITANNGLITTANIAGEGVNLNAQKDITTAHVTAENGGITFTSQLGAVASGNLTATGETQGNAVTVSALGDVNTGNIDTSSPNGTGGAIAITSKGGAVTSGVLNASGDAAGGAIAVNAQNNIIVGNLNSTSAQGTGGAIALKSQQGTITSSTITSSGATGGGAVTVSTPQNITVSDINSAANAGKGGAIALSSQIGIITGGNLTSSGFAGGGKIDVLTLGNLQFGQIDSSSLAGTAGKVTLNNQQPEYINGAPGINLAFINAQGALPGGGVDITTDGYFRATEIFLSQIGMSVSIATKGDPIVIRHGGGTAFDPFEAGNFIKNGTAGAISDGFGFLGTILPIQSFPEPIEQSQIQIIPRKPFTTNLPFKTLYPTVPNSSSVTEADTEVSNLDSIVADAFTDYLGPQPSVNNPADAPKILDRIQQQTSIRSAFIYATFFSDRLELTLVTAQGKKFISVPDATKEKVLAEAKKMNREITNPVKRRTTSYLSPSQQLYKWLIGPLQAELAAQNINNLVFIMDAGLRSLPVAVLHDGQGFLVEKYSVGIMPSLSLTDTSYVDIKNAPVLAMGISQANELAKEHSLAPLPAVPLELQTIVGIRPGKAFLDNKFTLENLQSQRQGAPIIHLATHGEFKSGPLENSYILMWDKLLRLDQVRQLGWNQRPSVELLVLSACRTATGDEKAELGFAGFAVQAGVKSALASLWYVSDEGTSGLMTEFYQQLQTAPIKAEALRQAQLGMIRGEVRLEGGQLRSSRGNVSLPPSLSELGDRNLSHPYYWAAFTMIGSPW